MHLLFRLELLVKIVYLMIWLIFKKVALAYFYNMP